MRIGNDEIVLEFGEIDRDGDVLVTTELNYRQQREYIVLNQKELKALIFHLQKQVKQDVPDI